MVFTILQSTGIDALQQLEGSEQDALRTAAFFPWDDNSLRTLWSGSLATEENLTKWTTVLDKFRDVIAIGGDTSVYVLWLKRRKHPLQIKIPEVCPQPHS